MQVLSSPKRTQSQTFSPNKRARRRYSSGGKIPPFDGPLTRSPLRTPERKQASKTLFSKIYPDDLTPSTTTAHAAAKRHRGKVVLDPTTNTSGLAWEEPPSPSRQAPKDPMEQIKEQLAAISLKQEENYADTRRELALHAQTNADRAAELELALFDTNDKLAAQIQAGALTQQRLENTEQHLALTKQKLTELVKTSEDTKQHFALIKEKLTELFKTSKDTKQQLVLTRRQLADQATDAEATNQKLSIQAAELARTAERCLQQEKSVAGHAKHIQSLQRDKTSTFPAIDIDALVLISSPQP